MIVTCPVHLIPLVVHVDGVRLCLRIAPTNRPVVHCPGDIWVWRTMVECYLRENRRTRRKTCPSATFFTTSPTWTEPDANLGLCGERPATNHLSHGMAYLISLCFGQNVDNFYVLRPRTITYFKITVCFSLTLICILFCIIFQHIDWLLIAVLAMLLLLWTLC
jgi:hypothetical protein